MGVADPAFRAAQETYLALHPGRGAEILSSGSTSSTRSFNSASESVRFMNLVIDLTTSSPHALEKDSCSW